MRNYFHCPLLLLAILAFCSLRSVAAQEAAAEHPGKYLTAALSFDGSLASLAGQSEVKVIGPKKFVRTPFGQGLLVDQGTWLQLPLEEQTFNRDAGTLMLWFMPERASRETGSDGVGVFRRIFSLGNEFSLHLDQFHQLVFSIGSKQIVTSEVDWQAGHWYHVAITWRKIGQEMEMALYFDGDQYRAMLGRGRGLLLMDFPVKSLNIASFGTKTQSLSAVVDEMGLFHRALESETIRAIFGHRMTIEDLQTGKPIELFPPLVNLAKGKPVAGQVAAQSRWFPYSAVVDGEPLGSQYARANPSEAIKAGLPVWLQVDLEEIAPINTIRLWNHTDGKMEDVRVAVSATGKFAGEEYVVHDNKLHGDYWDSRDGNRFVFPTQQARYIRCWNAGLSKDPKHPRYGTIRWREIMVFYDKLKEK